MKRTIIQTRPGEKDFHLFEELPASVYPGESIRLKQSDNINKEFLHSCYVMTEDSKPVARLALYFNPSLSYNSRSAACIGNYECIDDASAAAELIHHAEETAKKNAFSYIIGPMNGSTWDNYRFSTHNDHPNFFLEPYHNLYYNTHFTSSGYKPVANYISLIDRTMNYDFPAVHAREQELRDMGVKFRNIDLDDYAGDLKKIHAFSMEAFRNNFLFSPLRHETFAGKYLPLQRFIRPEQVIIAEHEGNMAGLVFCVNDLYSEEPVLILKTIARSKSRTYSGLGNVMGNMITRYAKENGYKAVIHAFIFDANISHTLSKEYSGESYKHYLLYGKEL